MKQFPIIDDDFLSDDEVEEYRKYFLGYPSKVRWSFMPKTSVSEKNYSDKIKNKIYESGSFTYFLLWNKDPNMSPPGSEHSLAILNKFLKKHEIALSEVIRSRVNLTTAARSEDSDKFYTPHIDLNAKHFGFIYYLNDSDGDTIFFNKSWPNDSILDENTEEILRVSPKAGRAILFNGLQYHAGSPCIDYDYRALINIDFI